MSTTLRSTSRRCLIAPSHNARLCLVSRALCPRAECQWNIKTTVGSQLASFVLVLGPYWAAPYLLISGAAPLPSVGRCCAAMIVYAVGVVMMCVADCYKAVTLEHKRGLITTGPFAHVRHPNYLGARARGRGGWIVSGEEAETIHAPPNICTNRQTITRPISPLLASRLSPDRPSGNLFLLQTSYCRPPTVDLLL